jgi:hypothetical protein
MYFHTGTHDAIVRFQSCDEREARDGIYVQEILPAFDKLVENLIFMHGFANIYGSYEDLKNDCITFLYETLKKFDASRGTKAFSYFNVVAKNWLIIKSKQRSKLTKKMVSLDDKDSVADLERLSVQDFNDVYSQSLLITKKQSFENLMKMLDQIASRLTNENEKACMEAIIKLFNSIDDLDLLNKRAIFVYMRDLSNLTPKQLSASMSAIRKHYKEISKSDDFDIFF